ncbi:hypothetical protein ZOSMA_218G00040, partial [Zostera marina]
IQPQGLECLQKNI